MKIPTLCGNHEVNVLYLVVDGNFTPFLGSCLSPGKGGGKVLDQYLGISEPLRV